MNDASVVEAVLFASDAPLSPDEIARADEALDEDRVEAALAELRRHYAESGRAFELREVAGGVQLLTRSEFAPYLERLDAVAKPARLSGPALEALAIVAYRQPISRVGVENVRGVNSSGVIRTLLARDLVHVVGRDEGIGRPVLYGTSPRFLEHFGFDSLDALPRPDELPVVLRDPSAAEAPAWEGGEPPAGGAETAEADLASADAVEAVLAQPGAEASGPSGDGGGPDAEASGSSRDGGGQDAEASGPSGDGGGGQDAREAVPSAGPPEPPPPDPSNGRPPGDVSVPDSPKTAR